MYPNVANSDRIIRNQLAAIIYVGGSIELMLYMSEGGGYCINGTTGCFWSQTWNLLAVWGWCGPYLSSGVPLHYHFAIVWGFHSEENSMAIIAVLCQELSTHYILDENT